MALVIAALCAEGTSTIGNVEQIDRGYERIDERLRELGAAIGAPSCDRRAHRRRHRDGERCDGRARPRPSACRAARAGGFDLALEIDPDDPEAEVDAAGTAFGRALAPRLVDGAHGDAAVAADEALAMVVVERSGRPLVASNADLTGAGRAGNRSRARSSAGSRWRRAHDPRAPDRGRGTRSRARGDLQGTRCPPLPRVWHTPAYNEGRRMDKTVIRTESAPSPFQGRPTTRPSRSATSCSSPARSGSALAGRCPR